MLKRAKPTYNTISSMTGKSDIKMAGSCFQLLTDGLYVFKCIVNIQISCKAL